MRARTVSLGVLLCLLCAGVVIVGVSADEPAAEMSVSGAIDTPTETVTIAGEEYDIDEIAVIEPGEPLEVHVSSSSNYFVMLYNENEQSEADRYMTSDEDVVVLGDENDDFDTNDLEPGTYMLSLEPSGDREAVTPVVVQGYDIDLTYPTTVEADSKIDLTATVEPRGSLDQPDDVEGVIWADGAHHEVTLEHDGGTEYSASVAADELASGTHNVYATVLGDDTVEGYPVSLAVEDGPQLTVDGDSEPDDDGPETDPENRTNETDEDDEPDDDQVDSDPENETADDTDDVIEPSDDTDADDTDAADDDQLGAPLFAVALLALVITVLVLWARTES